MINPMNPRTSVVPRAPPSLGGPRGGLDSRDGPRDPCCHGHRTPEARGGPGSVLRSYEVTKLLGFLGFLITRILGFAKDSHLYKGLLSIGDFGVIWIWLLFGSGFDLDLA